MWHRGIEFHARSGVRLILPLAVTAGFGVNLPLDQGATVSSCHKGTHAAQQSPIISTTYRCPKANGGAVRRFGLPGPRYTWSGALQKFGANWKLYLEGCALAQRRINPDATTVHLDDLLGDGEPETGPAFGFGVGAVDLMELLEDALPLLRRYAGPVSVTANSEVAIHGCRGDAHLAASVNLMALPTRLSSTCVRRCSSPRPTGRRLGLRP